MKTSHLIKFKCNFCGKIFEKSSECAKHIEKESVIGLCMPHDILVIYPERESDKINRIFGLVKT